MLTYMISLFLFILKVFKTVLLYRQPCLSLLHAGLELYINHANPELREIHLLLPLKGWDGRPIDTSSSLGLAFIYTSHQETGDGEEIE